jgi:hypothetical protein
MQLAIARIVALASIVAQNDPQFTTTCSGSRLRVIVNRTRDQAHADELRSGMGAGGIVPASLLVAQRLQRIDARRAARGKIRGCNRDEQQQRRRRGKADIVGSAHADQ